eukprot:scaffold2886_cov398-Prasinococcus_capsulatus_cf.AAC.8
MGRQRWERLSPTLPDQVARCLSSARTLLRWLGEACTLPPSVNSNSSSAVGPPPMLMRPQPRLLPCRTGDFRSPLWKTLIRLATSIEERNRRPPKYKPGNKRRG